MKITADTNLLLRIIVADDDAQSRAATRCIASAELIAITIPSLCELAWVLSRQYDVANSEVARSIRAIVESRGVVVDRPSVDAGLAILDAGGDFADGVIAHQGRWLGGDAFVSFDRKAVRLLSETGHEARLAD